MNAINAFVRLLEEFEAIEADHNCPKAYRYRYLREMANTGEGRPLVTICEIYGDRGLLARGLAFCSPLDNPCRKQGQRIALGRAQKALRLRDNIAPIQHGGKIFYVINTLWAFHRIEAGSFSYKGEYFDQMSPNGQQTGGKL